MLYELFGPNANGAGLILLAILALFILAMIEMPSGPGA